MLDSAHGFAYFGTSAHPGVVVQVRLSDLTRTGSVAPADGEDDLASAVIDAAGWWRDRRRSPLTIAQ